MMENKHASDNAQMLDKMYKNVKMGSDSMVNIISKVRDTALKEELTNQLDTLNGNDLDRIADLEDLILIQGAGGPLQALDLNGACTCQVVYSFGDKASFADYGIDVEFFLIELKGLSENLLRKDQESDGKDQENDQLDPGFNRAKGQDHGNQCSRCEPNSDQLRR